MITTVNFLPDLTQVYLILAVVLVWPNFLHVVPGFTAATAIDCTITRARAAVTSIESFLRMR